MVANDGRFAMEVVTVSGRAASVEWRIRRDWVEIWHHACCSGVFERKILRQWLADPVEPLAVDEVVLTLDRSVDFDGRVAVSLPDVQAWTLAPVAVNYLRRKI